ncbi:CD5 antigen-like isoform X1 [Pleurodeles waltl]
MGSTDKEQMTRTHAVMFLPLLLASWLGSTSSEFQVRLTDGSTSCSGRVEVNKDGRWGNVCDDGWDIKDAQIVCRQIGCGAAKLASASAMFGSGSESTPILMKDVECSGTENDLGQCQHEENVNPPCDHSEDAGVICEDPLAIRVVNGPNNCSGRLEVKHKDKWGTVCQDRWDMRDTRVACKQLGCRRPVSANKCDIFGKGSGPIWLDEVNCTGRESTLAECKASALGVHDCTHREDIGIECMEPVKVRLVDGPDACSGRLEVYYKHEWGTVCNDYWDFKDAEVVCRELACGGPKKHKLPRPKSDKAPERIWLDDVNCRGDEISLEYCQHRTWGYHDCNHKEDVSVSCSAWSSISGTV